jgi:DNA-binding NarL/FixJ family response regulator
LIKSYEPVTEAFEADSLDLQYFMAASKVGVEAFILKDSLPTYAPPLASLVRQVYQGRRYYDPKLNSLSSSSSRMISKSSFFSSSASFHRQ